MLSFGSRRFFLLFVLAGLLLIFFIYLDTYYHALDSIRHLSHQIGSQSSPTSAAGGGSWEFDPLRDATNYGLTEEQCDAAFPGLFDEPRLAAEHVRSSPAGKIAAEHLDIGWKKSQVLRAMIYDRELYIIDAKRVDWTRDRSLAVLGQIYRSITAYAGPLPNIEFVLAIDDAAWGDKEDQWPVWTFCRASDKFRHWVMPGFGFWAWADAEIGSYNEVRRKLAKSEPAFEDKIPKAIWRGAAGLHWSRGKLLEYSQDKPWADVKGITWDSKEDHISIPDHCKYQFVIHTEGAASSGRLKFLHNCHSVLLVPELTWLEPQVGLFKPDGPDQNVVILKNDFSDIDEKMQELLQNPDKARRLADNNAATFRDRYVTPAAISCYWRAMFRAWASVSFEPELYGTVNLTDPTTCELREQIGWRGQSWEKYMFSQVLYGKDKCVTKEELEKQKAEKEKADKAQAEKAKAD